MCSPRQRMTARLTAFISSRMLPGQLWASSEASASGVKPRICLPEEGGTELNYPRSYILYMCNAKYLVRTFTEKPAGPKTRTAAAPGMSVIQLCKSANKCKAPKTSINFFYENSSMVRSLYEIEQKSCAISAHTWYAVQSTESDQGKAKSSRIFEISSRIAQ